MPKLGLQSEQLLLLQPLPQAGPASFQTQWGPQSAPRQPVEVGQMQWHPPGSSLPVDCLAGVAQLMLRMVRRRQPMPADSAPHELENAIWKNLPHPPVLLVPTEPVGEAVVEALPLAGTQVAVLQAAAEGYVIVGAHALEAYHAAVAQPGVVHPAVVAQHGAKPSDHHVRSEGPLDDRTCQDGHQVAGAYALGVLAVEIQPRSWVHAWAHHVQVLAAVEEAARAIPAQVSCPRSSPPQLLPLRQQLPQQQLLQLPRVLASAEMPVVGRHPCGLPRGPTPARNTQPSCFRSELGPEEVIVA